MNYIEEQLLKIKNISAWLEIRFSELEAWSYAYKTEENLESKRKFRDNIYSSMFEFYSCYSKLLDIMKRNQKICRIPNEQILDAKEKIRDLVYTLNNFDELFKI